MTNLMKPATNNLRRVARLTPPRLPSSQPVSLRTQVVDFSGLCGSLAGF